MAVAEAAAPWLARQTAEAPLEKTLGESLTGVRYLASRLASRLPAHVDVEDLVQVGLMGLIQSAHRYDSERGVKFQTYANRRIQGAMLDYLRSLDWRPRSVRRRNRKLAQAVAAVEQRTGAAVSEEELSAEIGLSALELREWMQDYASAGSNAAPSFQDGRADDAEDPLASIADPGQSPEEAVEEEEMRSVVAKAIDHLPENERAVLSLYYYEHFTMKEIGKVLGVKQARVSQLHSQAVRRLRLRMRKGTQTSPLSAATK